LHPSLWKPLGEEQLQDCTSLSNPQLQVVLPRASQRQDAHHPENNKFKVLLDSIEQTISIFPIPPPPPFQQERKTFLNTTHHLTNHIHSLHPLFRPAKMGFFKLTSFLAIVSVAVAGGGGTPCTPDCTSVDNYSLCLAGCNTGCNSEGPGTAGCINNCREYFVDLWAVLC